jgi:hypothetical protein
MRKYLRGSIAAALVAALFFSSLAFNSADARSRHHGRANAAVLGAVLGVFGAVATLAARDAYRDRYYAYGPGPYYAPPYAYYPPPVYRYRYRHWHRHHHH